jgi:hypothetical protein
LHNQTIPASVAHNHAKSSIVTFLTIGCNGECHPVSALLPGRGTARVGHLDTLRSAGFDQFEGAMMSSENQAGSGASSHSAPPPNGSGFTRVDSAGLWVSADHLDAAAELLTLHAKRIADQAPVAPSGGDPVSMQSARVLRAAVLDQWAAVQAGVAAFRERAEIVRTQVTRIEQTEYESRARFTEESS